MPSTDNSVSPQTQAIFGGGGSYDPSSGVYIDSKGQGQSRATAPAGATISKIETLPTGQVTRITPVGQGMSFMTPSGGGGYITSTGQSLPVTERMQAVADAQKITQIRMPETISREIQTPVYSSLESQRQSEIDSQMRTGLSPYNQVLPYIFPASQIQQTDIFAGYKPQEQKADEFYKMISPSMVPKDEDLNNLEKEYDSLIRKEIPLYLGKAISSVLPVPKYTTPLSLIEKKLPEVLESESKIESKIQAKKAGLSYEDYLAPTAYPEDKNVNLYRQAVDLKSGFNKETIQDFIKSARQISGTEGNFINIELPQNLQYTSNQVFKFKDNKGEDVVISFFAPTDLSKFDTSKGISIYDRTSEAQKGLGSKLRLEFNTNPFERQLAAQKVSEDSSSAIQVQLKNIDKLKNDLGLIQDKIVEKQRNTAINIYGTEGYLNLLKNDLTTTEGKKSFDTVSIMQEKSTLPETSFFDKISGLKNEIETIKTIEPKKGLIDEAMESKKELDIMTEQAQKDKSIVTPEFIDKADKLYNNYASKINEANTLLENSNKDISTTTNDFYALQRDLKQRVEDINRISDYSGIRIKEATMTGINVLENYADKQPWYIQGPERFAIGMFLKPTQEVAKFALGKGFEDARKKDLGLKSLPIISNIRTIYDPFASEKEKNVDLIGLGRYGIGKGIDPEALGGLMTLGTLGYSGIAGSKAGYTSLSAGLKQPTTVALKDVLKGVAIEQGVLLGLSATPEVIKLATQKDYTFKEAFGNTLENLGYMEALTLGSKAMYKSGYNVGQKDLQNMISEQINIAQTTGKGVLKPTGKVSKGNILLETDPIKIELPDGKFLEVKASGITSNNVLKQGENINFVTDTTFIKESRVLDKSGKQIGDMVRGKPERILESGPVKIFEFTDEFGNVKKVYSVDTSGIYTKDTIKGSEAGLTRRKIFLSEEDLPRTEGISDALKTLKQTSSSDAVFKRMGLKITSDAEFGKSIKVTPQAKQNLLQATKEKSKQFGEDLMSTVGDLGNKIGFSRTRGGIIADYERKLLIVDESGKPIDALVSTSEINPVLRNKINSGELSVIDYRKIPDNQIPKDYLDFINKQSQRFGTVSETTSSNVLLSPKGKVDETWRISPGTGGINYGDNAFLKVVYDTSKYPEKSLARISFVEGAMPESKLATIRYSGETVPSKELFTLKIGKTTSPESKFFTSLDEDIQKSIIKNTEKQSILGMTESESAYIKNIDDNLQKTVTETKPLSGRVETESGSSILIQEPISETRMTQNLKKISPELNLGYSSGELYGASEMSMRTPLKVNFGDVISRQESSLYPVSDLFLTSKMSQPLISSGYLDTVAKSDLSLYTKQFSGLDLSQQQILEQTSKQESTQQAAKISQLIGIERMGYFAPNIGITGIPKIPSFGLPAIGSFMGQQGGGRGKRGVYGWVVTNPLRDLPKEFFEKKTGDFSDYTGAGKTNFEKRLKELL